MDWHIHWEVLGLLLLLEGGYLLAVGPLRSRFVWPQLVRPSRRQLVLFSLGVFVIFLAEGTPIHELSEQYLFSVHMAQHLLLTMLAVPLLLLGTPPWLIRPLLDHPLLGAALRWATRPLIAIVLFNGTLAFWHLPQFYELTLWDHNAHILEHLLFMATAVCLWWPVLSPLPELPRLSYPLQMLYLFVQSLVPAVIASLITFADRMIYPTYAAAPRIAPLTPLADQQLGGLIMKTVGTVVLWLVATIIFFLWVHQEGREPQEGPEPAPPRAAERS
jgi:putative membrane protein